MYVLHMGTRLQMHNRLLDWRSVAALVAHGQGLPNQTLFKCSKKKGLGFPERAANYFRVLKMKTKYVTTTRTKQNKKTQARTREYFKTISGGIPRWVFFVRLRSFEFIICSTLQSQRMMTARTGKCASDGFGRRKRGKCGGYPVETSNGSNK